MILFHGTSDEIVVPTYGKGEEKHDYGQGFYLTESIDLAKEWAICRPNETNGYAVAYFFYRRAADFNIFLKLLSCKLKNEIRLKKI